MTDQNVADTANTVNDNGSAVLKRIPNAASVRSIFKSMTKSDEIRSTERAKIKGMIDGHRPYSEKELRAKGMAWRCNVNWREGEGIIDGTTNSYTELVMELPELAKITVKPISEIRDPDGELGQIISEEYTETLNRWKKFIPNYNIMVRQFAMYGKGFYFWADPYNWMYEAIKTGNVLIPENSGVMLEDNGLVMIKGSMSPLQAFQLINNDQAGTYGWNIKELKAAMVKMYTKPTETVHLEQLASEYESLQHDIALGNLGLDDPAFQNMPIVYSLEKSLVMDGKIRMSIVRTNDDDGGYLFEKADLYADMYQALSMFVFNYGEGDFHDIRGLGKKSYAHVEASNRLMNNIMDGTTLMNTLMVTGTKSAVNDAMKITRFGPITIIPEALNIVQQSFQPRMDASLLVRQSLSQSLNNNTGQSKAQTETGAVERVAAAVKYRAGKEHNFSVNERMLFYSQWDGYHQEIVRRMLNPDYPSNWPGKKEVEEFIDNCVARGVPKQLLKIKNLNVRAVRALGTGAASDKEEATQELVKMATAMPEEGAQNAFRDRASVLVGYSNVNRYFPKNAKNIPTNEHSIAQLENNDMFEGSVVIVGTDQRHTIHLDIHLQKLLDIGEQFQEMPDQVDLATLARYFITAVEHCIQHNQIAAANPVLADDAQMYAETIKAVAGIRDEVIREAQKLIAEQQRAGEAMQEEAQQEQDPELRMKLERHAVSMQILMNESKSRVGLKEQMQKHTIRMREMKEAHRMALQRQKG